MMSDASNGSGIGDWPDQILAQIDDKHLAYLCQYGIVHLLWDDHNLVYCPGDFLGLPFLLSSLTPACDVKYECEAASTQKWVTLQYHSVTLLFTCGDCLKMCKLVQEAAERLSEISNNGHYLNRSEGNSLSA